MCVFEITPRPGAWRLTSQGETEGLEFATFLEAERGARWLAIRQDVRGIPTEIHILDRQGALVGTWRGERYETGLTVVLDQVA